MNAMCSTYCITGLYGIDKGIITIRIELKAIVYINLASVRLPNCFHRMSIVSIVVLSFILKTRLPFSLWAQLHTKCI